MGDDKAKGGKKDTRTKRVIQIDVQTPLPQKGEPWLLVGFEVDKFHLVCPEKEKENQSKNDTKKKDKDEEYSHCELLNELISLVNKPTLNISIIGMEGRASETGPWNNNYYLSKRRVEEVQKYLRTHGKINVNKIRFLGQKYPLEMPSGPGPHNLEIDKNRSVQIYVRVPPMAIARVLARVTRGTKIDLNNRTAYYHPNSDSIDPEFITLDGTESYVCKGFSIVSYLWEHIGARRTGGPNPNEVIELIPYHSLSMKGVESEYPGYEESRKKYRGISDHSVVKFRLEGKLLDVLRNNNTIVLTFRLTVTDEDNLKNSTTVEVTITPISQKRNLIFHEWGLKMEGSVSLRALKLGVEKYGSVKGTSIGLNASAGIGGMFALGVLKRYSDNSRQLILYFSYFATGADLKVGIKKGIDSAVLEDPRRLLKIRTVKELLKELDIDIDNPWENFTKFQCNNSTFEEFDGDDAEMFTADAHAIFVGKGMGRIKFRRTKIYPPNSDNAEEREKADPIKGIDIGGFLVKKTTMLGGGFEKSIGKVYTFSPEDFFDALKHFNVKIIRKVL